MFAALMTEHCGLTSWETNSEIVHLVAQAPLGPFLPARAAGVGAGAGTTNTAHGSAPATRAGSFRADQHAKSRGYAPVVARFAHNPTIHRNAEGRYLL